MADRSRVVFSERSRPKIFCSVFAQVTFGLMRISAYSDYAGTAVMPGRLRGLGSGWGAAGACCAISGINPGSEVSRNSRSGSSGRYR